MKDLLEYNENDDTVSQKQVNYLVSPISPKGTEQVIKKLLTKKKKKVQMLQQRILLYLKRRATYQHSSNSFIK